LSNEDTVPYTVHIGTAHQITPHFAENFVIYLHRFPELEPRPARCPKRNLLIAAGFSKEPLVRLWEQ
jgi:hypothetical protein